MDVRAGSIRRVEVPVERIETSAFVVPTATPESDGTYEWDATTLVVVEAEAGGVRSLGYTYADTSTARLVHDRLAEVIDGCDAMAPDAAWQTMVRAVRNLGRPGIASMAIAAVDASLWDLKARLLGLPLVTLLGAVRPSVPVYGSGGFTSYSIEALRRQLVGWVSQAISRVKMKVGRDPSADPGGPAGSSRHKDRGGRLQLPRAGGTADRAAHVASGRNRSRIAGRAAVGPTVATGSAVSRSAGRTHRPWGGTDRAAGHAPARPRPHAAGVA